MVNCKICSKAVNKSQDPHIIVGGDDEIVHTACFKCEGCKEDIPVDKWIDKDNKYYCMPCFTNNVAPKCTACSKPLDGEFLKLGSESYHKDCFICSECQHGITGKFFKLEGKPCCESCWEAKSSKCFICKQKVLDKKIVAAHNIVFHPDCFKCKVCALEIGEGQFVPKGDTVYHKDCYAKETGETPSS